MKTYLAWIGQDATFGSPHPQTGNHSYFGELFSFSSKSDRDLFCDTLNHKHNAYPHKVTQREARNKHLGMSVEDYREVVLKREAQESAKCFLSEQ